ALVGFGVRGRQWARVIRDDQEAELSAVIDPDEGARRMAPAPTWPTLDAALGQVAVDAVIIASPPAFHAADALPAMEGGLRLLCENPLPDSPAAAPLLATASERTGVPLLVGMNFRYVPATQVYRRIVRSAELGEPLFAQFTYVRNRDGRRPDLNSFP